MGPVALFGFWRGSASIFPGMAALYLLFVILGGVPGSNGKLLPREVRKPPSSVSNPSPSAAAVKGQYASIGIQKLQKLQKARDRALTQGITGSLEMSMERFEELIFDPPRNYSTFVMFYSGDQGRCRSCEDAVHAFNSAASAYILTYGGGYEQWSGMGSLFFVRVKINGGQGQTLDLPTLYPSLFYFAPSASSKVNQFERLDSELMIKEDGQFNVVGMIKWIQIQRPDLKFTVTRDEPASMVSPTNLCIVVLLGMLALFSLYYSGHFETFVELLKDFNYSYFVTIIVLWLVSGQMYNYIRATATMGNGDLTSLTTYISPGSRYQYGVESLIVMILYSMLIYGMIELIKAREREMGIPPAESLALPTNDNSPPPSAATVHNPYAGQNNVMTSLSCVFFGFMALQVIVQIKTYY